MRRYLASLLSKALSALDVPTGADLALSPPRDPSHGDMGTSVAMKVAGIAGEPSREVAERIVAAMEVDPRFIASVAIDGPGFINVRFTPLFFQTRLAEALELGERYGHVESSATLCAAVADRFGIDPMLEGTDGDPLRAIRYAHAQAAGLLRHADQEGWASSAPTSLEPLRSMEELELIRSIILYPDFAERSATLADPSHLIAYLNDLAEAFNRFDRAHRIISAAPGLRDARLRLLLATATVFDAAMRLLELSRP
jgi:arginyl-tRNA synthetase